MACHVALLRSVRWLLWISCAERCDQFVDNCCVIFRFSTIYTSLIRNSLESALRLFCVAYYLVSFYIGV